MTYPGGALACEEPSLVRVITLYHCVIVIPLNPRIVRRL